MKHLLALSIVLALAGCDPGQTLVTPPTPPHLVPAPQALTTRCEPPVVLRKGALTQQQDETAWGVDDDHLIQCGHRLDSLAQYYAKRDAAIMGASKK